MSKDQRAPYRFLEAIPERPAWGVIAQRGECLLGDAGDRDMRQDLLCALMLGLYPGGPSG